MVYRALKQHTFARAEQWGFIQRLQRLGDRPGSLYILTYHRVGYPDDLPHQGLDLFGATPEQFDQQMALIARFYNPVSAEDVLAVTQQRKTLPRDAVLITVDDGYRDFKEYIFPIAKQYGIRPILFVPTKFVGGVAFWWDRLAVALQLSQRPEIQTPIGVLPLKTAVQRAAALSALSHYVRTTTFDEACWQIEQLCDDIAPRVPALEHSTLDWDELRALDRAGVTIASHTHSHPIISHVPLEQARAELRHSQEIIHREIGHALPIFAFPDGRPIAVSEDVVQILREEGFELAFTRTERRANIYHDDLLQLPRLGVVRVFSLPQFHFHLTPLYQTWKRYKR